MSTSTLLEPTKFFILLALSKGAGHGLAIQEQIVADTLGVYLKSSSLYDAMKRLLELELIEVRADDGYRRSYALTDKGARKLENEARMYDRAVRYSRERLQWQYGRSWQ